MTTMPSPSFDHPADGITVDLKDRQHLAQRLSRWSDDQLRQAITANRRRIDDAGSTDDIGPLFHGVVLLRKALKERSAAG